MKKIFLLGLFTLAIFTISCSDDEKTPDHEEPEVGAVAPEYEAMIISPDAEDKQMGGKIDLNILFESATKQTVHHAKIKIYDKNDPTKVIFEKPEEAHVHKEEGKFEFTEELIINEENGFAAHTDWILEAKVWGHDAGVGEEMKTIQFHVHPGQ